jgi:hypothetical protein
MGRKIRKEEEALLSRIREFKKEFRERRVQELFNERIDRHSRGEVFFKGYWVPRERLSAILRSLRRKGLVIFIEVHLLFFTAILFSFLIWLIFKRFFLP